jgi:hypothetical protein
MELDSDLALCSHGSGYPLLDVEPGSFEQLEDGGHGKFLIISGK